MGQACFLFEHEEHRSPSVRRTMRPHHKLFQNNLSPSKIICGPAQVACRAAQRHRAQARKGTTISYIAHLMQVAGIALENGATEEEAIAVLLHDVMEDQDVSESELTRRFGPEVAAIVAGCSDSASTEKAPWHKRKEAYIARATLADY